MQNTLTVEQRHKVYEALLKVVLEDPSVHQGMCFYLAHVLDDDPSMPHFWRWLIGVGKMEVLDELMKHAVNEDFSGYWAPRSATGWKTRIKWIMQAIEDTKEQKSPKRFSKKAAGIKNTTASKTRVKRKQ